MSLEANDFRGDFIRFRVSVGLEGSGFLIVELSCYNDFEGLPWTLFVREIGLLITKLFLDTLLLWNYLVLELSEELIEEALY